MIGGGCVGVLIHWLSHAPQCEPEVGVEGVRRPGETSVSQVMSLAYLSIFQRGSVVSNR